MRSALPEQVVEEVADAVAVPAGAARAPPAPPTAPGGRGTFESCSGGAGAIAARRVLRLRRRHARRGRRTAAEAAAGRCGAGAAACGGRGATRGAAACGATATGGAAARPATSGRMSSSRASSGAWPCAARSIEVSGFAARRRRRRRRRLRRIVGAARHAGQVRRRQALVRGLHEAAPDLDRHAAAGQLLGRRIVVIAEPHAGDQMAGVADEPGVAEILAGAGLAGGREAAAASALRAVPVVSVSCIIWFIIATCAVVDDAAEARVARAGR